MAIRKDTQVLTDYLPNTLPSLGNPERYLAAELANISKSIRKINEVLKRIEDRMNTNGLS
jgi:hypothetical protein